MTGKKIFVPKIKPHKREEDALFRQGYHFVAGVDEAGRGAWAGPLVAGAVILPNDFRQLAVNDSKKLSPKQREKMFVHITANAVSWAVATASAKLIDTKGITIANRQVLQQAVTNLHIKPQAVLVDAVKIKVGRQPVKAFIHGDAKILSIAAASIIAKVTRDELMRGWHRLYPQYEFNKHKGYGTRRHQHLIKKHGSSPIHRVSWTPFRTTTGRRNKIR